MAQKSEKELAIVIPTYNRSQFLDKQIEWVSSIIADKWNEIELVISDNCSNDQTEEVCNKWKNKLNDNIKIYRNEENVGLVKNCLRGIKNATAKFVWLVGDDDAVEKRSIDLILDKIKKYPDLNLIHVNHRCINGITDEVINPHFYKQNEDMFVGADSYKGVESLLNTAAHTGGFMFITACILNRTKAVEFIDENPVDKKSALAYPLLINMALALTGPFVFISEPCIDCVYNRSSWLDRFRDVYQNEVPAVLVKLRKFGLKKGLISKLIRYQYSSLETPGQMMKILGKSGNRKAKLKTWLKYFLLKKYYQSQVIF